MINMQKQKSNTAVVIRTATGHELSEYEKNKLANIEENAQANKIEVISINGQRVQLDPVQKEAKINLGNLAFRSAVGPVDIASDELFFIQCSLDDE